MRNASAKTSVVLAVCDREENSPPVNSLLLFLSYSFILFRNVGSCGLAGSSGGLASFVFALIFCFPSFLFFVFLIHNFFFFFFSKTLLFFPFSFCRSISLQTYRTARSDTGSEQTKYKRATQQNGRRRRDKGERE